MKLDFDFHSKIAFKHFGCTVKVPQTRRGVQVEKAEGGGGGGKVQKRGACEGKTWSVIMSGIIHLYIQENVFFCILIVVWICPNLTCLRNKNSFIFRRIIFVSVLINDNKMTARQ